MHVATSLAPNGLGMIPFRHRGFDQESPAWDLHQRAAVLGFEITGRDDNDTPTSVGAWKEDSDTRGDLNCANYWQADYSQRPVGCWGFGYPSVIKTTGGNGSTAGVVDTRTQGQQGGTSKVLPIGKSGNPDTRFQPKQPLIIQPEGSGGGDPNSPNAGMNGDAGANGANGLTGMNGDPNSSDSGASIDLGGGWVYQDGTLAYFGPSPGSVDSLSGFNGGYFGGSIGFSGIPASNFSSGFPTFGGVGNFFGNGGSVGFTWNNR